MSRLSVMPSIIIEHLAMCRYWISRLDLISSIIWFDLISSIIWYNLISLIYWFDLITLDELLFTSYPRGRWWKTPLITFRRLWLVMPRPHTKYTRMLYPYITNNSSYSNPGCPRNRGLVKTWVIIIWSISCVEVIVIYIYVLSFSVRHILSLCDNKASFL